MGKVWQKWTVYLKWSKAIKEKEKEGWVCMHVMVGEKAVSHLEKEKKMMVLSQNGLEIKVSYPPQLASIFPSNYYIHI